MRKQLRAMIGPTTAKDWVRSVNPTGETYRDGICRAVKDRLRNRVSNITLGDQTFVSMWHLCDMYTLRWRELGLSDQSRLKRR